MIQKLDITGINFEVNDDLKKYVAKKFGNLDKYLSKHARESVHIEVKLREQMRKAKKDCTCEVMVHLPRERLTAVETTMNMFAAVDICEANLKNQLRKYKETHGSLGLHKRVLARIKRYSYPPAE